MREIKKEEGGGNIIELMNLHFLYHYSYLLILTFSKLNLN
jgi:hypothetical protein